MKSNVYSVVAITKCLRDALPVSKRGFGLKKPEWHGRNAMQKLMLKYMANPLVEQVEEAFKSSELKTAVDFEHKVQIDLTTTLNVKVKWRKKGTEAAAGKYQGVELSNASFLMAGSDVAVALTKNGDLFFMKKKPIEAKNGIELTQKVAKITETYLKNMQVGVKPDFTSFIFPKVSLDMPVSLTGLKRMDLGEEGDGAFGDHYIGVANKHVSLEMDTLGARVKVVVRISIMTKGEAPKPKKFIISGPFTMWCVRKNTSFPYFVANIDTDAFSKSV